MVQRGEAVGVIAAQSIGCLLYTSKLYCTDPDHEDFDTVIQDVFLGPIPVSYTHLDVYKRQELRSRQQFDKPSVVKRLKKERAVYVQQLQQVED